MVDNTIGGIGISPLAKGRVVSQCQKGYSSLPTAIATAIAICSPGDFILIEAQEYDPASGTYFWPVEIATANFQLIQLATTQNITIIEPAANGSYSLDQYKTASEKYIFNRTSPDFRDSGAIMVAASTSGSVHTRLSFSNFGSRIDLFAWGENVVTTWTTLSEQIRHILKISMAHRRHQQSSLAQQSISRQQSKLGWAQSGRRN